MRCDLHIHSNQSFDATDSVDSIIKQAIDKKIDCIAIADHNQMDGYYQAMKIGGIDVISAIEIDCFFNDKVIHIIGYGCDLKATYFQELKMNYYNELQRINKQRLALINERYACNLDEDKIKALANPLWPYTNVEICKVLLQDVKHPDLEIYQTGDKSMNPLANFYWDNLVIGKWGYCELKLPNYLEVIEMIKKYHGVAICAHPKITLYNEKEAIKQLVADGIDGFEVYSSYHDENDRQLYHEICCEYKLLETLGSDYHGENKPNIIMGEVEGNFDCDKIVNELKELINERWSKHE